MKEYQRECSNISYIVLRPADERTLESPRVDPVVQGLSAETPQSGRELVFLDRSFIMPSSADRHRKILDDTLTAFQENPAAYNVSTTAARACENRPADQTVSARRVKNSAVLFEGERPSSSALGREESPLGGLHQNALGDGQSHR